MSISTPLPGTAIDPLYPDSDGQPMGETGFHVSASIVLYTTLTNFFRGRQDVFVGGDMFVYYERGNPRACKAPDVFAAIGVAGNHERRSFRLWEELVGPTAVFEVTSSGTFDEDDLVKPLVYAQIGVKEYFMFDPDCENLDPPLKGRRLADGDYEIMVPDRAGRLMSRELGLLLEVDGPLLRTIDARTGERLLSSEEFADANDELRHRLEKLERQAEAEKRRAAALEAELRRLGGTPPP